MLGPYDVLVIVALALGWFAGRSKGFAWQVSGIATLFLGFVAAAAGAGSVAPFFPDAWPQDLRRYAAWTAIYASVSIAIYVATLALSKKLKQLELDELDRRFGGALGAAKAGLLVAALSLVAVAGSERAREFVQASSSGWLLAQVGTAARPLLPERIGKALDRSLERLDPHPEDAAPTTPATHPTAPALPTTPVRPVGPRPTSPPPRVDGGPVGASPRPAPTRPSRPPKPAPSPDAPITTDTPAMDDGESGGDDEPDPSPTPARPEPRDPLIPR